MPQVSVLPLRFSINTVRVKQQEGVINQRHTEVAPELPELILWLGVRQKHQEKVEEQPLLCRRKVPLILRIQNSVIEKSWK